MKKKKMLKYVTEKWAIKINISMEKMSKIKTKYWVKSDCESEFKRSVGCVSESDSNFKLSNIDMQQKTG